MYRRNDRSADYSEKGAKKCSRNQENLQVHTETNVFDPIDPVPILKFFEKFEQASS